MVDICVSGADVMPNLLNQANGLLRDFLDKDVYGDAVDIKSIFYTTPTILITIITAMTSTSITNTNKKEKEAERKWVGGRCRSKNKEGRGGGVSEELLEAK